MGSRSSGGGLPPGHQRRTIRRAARRAWPLLDEREHRYAVDRETSSEPDRHSSRPAPVVRLVPSDPAASPLTIVFEAFPGLLVRIGRGEESPLPISGCDACDEDVTGCVERLQELIGAVTAGTFGERLIRGVRRQHERWYHGANASWVRRTRVRGRQLGNSARSFRTASCTGSPGRAGVNPAAERLPLRPGRNPSGTSPSARPRRSQPLLRTVE